MIETAERLAGLTDGELADLHERIDTHGPADAMIVEAHHLVTTEMLKRGIQHGHEGDSWADAAIVVDEVVVSGPDEIEAPAGFEKAFQDSLAGGGSVRVMLTVDGYVLKADPTVSDVHVDTIMPGRRRRVEKADWEVGDFASWNSSGGMARGKIERILAEGVLQIPDSSFSINAEDDDPAVLLRVYRRSPDGWRATDTMVGHKASTLTRIEPLEKAASYPVPEDVQAAARQAVKWIEDGRAGDGFTAVGRGRARQLADGGSVSRDVLVKMRAYFARHIVDKDADGWGDRSDPTPGMVAWYAWGGDPGRAWANRVLGDVEKRAIPAAITDLHLNVQNRQHAIDEYLYGPMNPDMPGDYWQRLGDVWGVSADEAATTRCHNCAAFNMTSEIQGAIAEAIGDGGAAVVEAAELGYCELLAFKCAADRSCSVWLTGGPIADESDGDAMEEEFLASLTDVDKEWYGQVSVVLDAGGDPDFVMQKAGNPEALRDYWRAGGKGKISWGAGGDFTACVAAVGKYMTSEQAKGYCAIRHREVTGMWPGDKRNRETKKSVGTALPEVPQPTVNVTYNISPGGADGLWTQVLKHPGHPDQKVAKHGKHDQSTHGRRGGASGAPAATLKTPEDVPPEPGRSADAVRLAGDVRARAVEVEPGVTADMQRIARAVNGRMEGLDHRLKSTDSLARKIDQDAEKEHGGDREAAAAKVSDAVRYTMVVDDEGYTAGVRATLTELSDAGYSVDRVKNFWAPGDPYDGVNVKLSKDGVVVEFQIHSPSSFRTKEKTLHPIYEKYREEKDDEKRASLWQEMVTVATRDIRRPAAYATLLGVGSMAIQTFETAAQAGLV